MNVDRTRGGRRDCFEKLSDLFFSRTKRRSKDGNIDILKSILSRAFPLGFNVARKRLQTHNGPDAFLSESLEVRLTPGLGSIENAGGNLGYLKAGMGSGAAAAEQNQEKHESKLAANIPNALA